MPTSKFLPLLICGQLCVSAAADSAEPTAAQSKPVVVPPAQAVQVGFDKFPEVAAAEGFETKDRKAIQRKAEALLAAKDYDQLEQLAGDLRASKAAYVDGYWKLWAFYQAFGEFPKKATEDQWTGLLDSLREWVKERPDSITARVALADALTGYAWKARTGGYADTVTETGWNLFHQRLLESRDVLKGAQKLEATCPHWFAVAQRIALGQGWPPEEYEKLFRAAVHREPTYFNFYTRKVVHLMPRWYGKQGEWEKFADEIADRVGGEEGDILYARIAWFVQDLGFYKDLFRETQINGNRVKRGYELMLNRYPESFTVVAQFGRLAVVSGDRFRTRAMLERLGDKVDVEIWSSTEFFKRVRDWAYKGSTPAGAEAIAPVSSTLPVEGAAPPLKRELTLNGLSGPKSRRLAMINGQTLGAGESARIRLLDSEVKVRCEEIREDSVIVTINGQPEQKTLHLRAGG